MPDSLLEWLGNDDHDHMAKLEPLYIAWITSIADIWVVQTITR